LLSKQGSFQFQIALLGWIVTKMRILATCNSPLKPFCDCAVVTVIFERRHDMVLTEV